MPTIYLSRDDLDYLIEVLERNIKDLDKQINDTTSTVHTSILKDFRDGDQKMLDTLKRERDRFIDDFGLWGLKEEKKEVKKPSKKKRKPKGKSRKSSSQAKTGTHSTS